MGNEGPANNSSPPDPAGTPKPSGMPSGANAAPAEASFYVYVNHLEVAPGRILSGPGTLVIGPGAARLRFQALSEPDSQWFDAELPYPWIRNTKHDGVLLTFEIEPAKGAIELRCESALDAIVISTSIADRARAMPAPAAYPSRSMGSTQQPHLSRMPGVPSTRVPGGTLRSGGRWGAVTWGIVAVNALVFLAMLASGVSPTEPTSAQMLHWGADYWLLTTGGQWWRLLTSTFLHFGLLHLGFNMWALVYAGPLTERLFGKWFYAGIYLAGGIFASLSSMWFNKTAISAGASGAIFAVFGMLLAFLLIQRHVLNPAALKSLVISTGIFVIYNLGYGFVHQGTDNYAHIGGLVSGFLLGMIAARPLVPEPRRRQALPKAIAVISTTLVAGACAFVFIPKSGFDLAKERAFAPAIAALNTTDAQTTDALNSIEHEFHDNKITFDQARQQINDQVLKKIDAMFDQIAHSDLEPKSPSMKFKVLSLKFLDLRRQYARILMKSPEPSDADQATLKEMNKRMEAMLPELEQAEQNAWHEE